ncbi:hypothetical protein HMPREF9127_0653 [Parvimonas sp. oral taxon 393 str. F0440]|nr:hypothetical protein HMPREF9127_0653 [Parvimonas sp. oral taxon 393 str. F0440]
MSGQSVFCILPFFVFFYENNFKFQKSYIFCLDKILEGRK